MKLDIPARMLFALSVISIIGFGQAAAARVGQAGKGRGRVMTGVQRRCRRALKTGDQTGQE